MLTDIALDLGFCLASAAVACGLWQWWVWGPLVMGVRTQRDAWQHIAETARDRVQADIDDLETQRTKWINYAHQLEAELATSHAQRDDLITQLAAARVERDAAVRRANVYDAAYCIAADERDAALAERDAARADLARFRQPGVRGPRGRFVGRVTERAQA